MAGMSASVVQFERKPQAKICTAIIGITDEGAEMMEEYKGSPALDAGLLAAAQAVEHCGRRRQIKCAVALILAAEDEGPRNSLLARLNAV
jgi:ferritin-like metal-binding protein YciE